MFSVIICTYNRDKYIYQTLKRIACNKIETGKYEIILVDNNSTDNTELECRRFVADYPEVNYFYFKELNQGLSYARNRGVKESRGDVLVFLDDDSFVNDDYLSNLQNYIDNYPDAMAFGGKITPLFEDGITPKWLCSWNYSWVSAIDMGKKVAVFKSGKYPIGANMGVKKECVDRCGLFNTNLGRTKKNLMGGEEKDFFNRVKDNGFTIYYFPDIEVNHLIPPSRTTKEYIEKLGHGIGLSEYRRCKDISGISLVKRRIAELVKWAATIVLWFFYMLIFRIKVGNMLVVFRYNVSKGLFCGLD